MARRRRQRRALVPRAFAGLGAVPPVVTSHPEPRRLLGIPLWAWGAVGVSVTGLVVWLVANSTGPTVEAPVLDSRQQTIFNAALPDHARPYGGLILRVASEQDVDPFAIFALGDRESLWGTARAYQQQTGDWSPRSRTAVPSSVPESALRDATQAEKDKFKLSGSSRYVMPVDGLGWGRGLMQIDYAWQYPWISKNNWRDAYTNIAYGASYLKQLLSQFAGTKDIGSIARGGVVTVGEDYAKWRKLPGRGGTYKDPRPLTGTALQAAAIAAYNTGPANVIRNLALGLTAEASTTGGDYTADTMKRQSDLLARFQSAGGGPLVA